MQISSGRFSKLSLEEAIFGEMMMMVGGLINEVFFGMLEAVCV